MKKASKFFPLITFIGIIAVVVALFLKIWSITIMGNIEYGLFDQIQGFPEAEGEYDLTSGLSFNTIWATFFMISFIATAFFALLSLLLSVLKLAKVGKFNFKKINFWLSALTTVLFFVTIIMAIVFYAGNAFHILNETYHPVATAIGFWIGTIGLFVAMIGTFLSSYIPTKKRK